MKRVKWRNWLPIIGYLSAVTVVFGGTLAPPAGQLIFGDDIHRQYYFYREFFNYFLSHGIFPWWNPYLFGGEPFIGNPVVNIWYPPTWLFVLLPLNLAYSLHLALHILMAMLGMRWLLKKVIRNMGEIKESEIGVWTGGLVFGLSGFFMARVWAGHVDVVAAASWMPWVVGAFWSLTDRGNQGNWGRKIVFAAVLFAIQLYAGYQTMAFFTVEIVGIVTLLHCYIVKRFRPLFRVIAAGLLGLGLAGLQIIPEQEFFRLSIRTYSLPYSWAAYGSLTLDGLKQFINPFYFGDQLTYHGPAPNYIEPAAFIGRVALALALFALLKLLTSFKKGRANFAALVFAVITIFGVWLSLGSNAPIDLQEILWQILPMYHYLRIPARHMILVVFALSGLTGMGLISVKNRWLKLLLAVLILVELILFDRHFIATKEIPETRHDPDLINLLKSDKELFRVLPDFGVWVPPRDSFDFDSSTSYRVFNASGYDPSILKSYYEYVAKAAGKSGNEAILSQDVQVPYLTPAAADALDRLNIKYLVVPPQYDPFRGNDRYRLIKENSIRQYLVYENTTVLPRFYLADKTCGDVKIKSFSPNIIELSVNSSCKTQLLSSEVDYPGWEATIDGKKTDIFTSDLAFRTIEIPDGIHRIVYAYQPTIFLIGGVVSILSLILSAAIIFINYIPVDFIYFLKTMVFIPALS